MTGIGVGGSMVLVGVTPHQEHGKAVYRGKGASLLESQRKLTE
jgi:hypothetical protein